VRYDVDSTTFIGDTGLARGPGVVYQGSRTTGVLTAGTHNFQAHCIDSLGQTAMSNSISKTLSPVSYPPCNAGELVSGGTWNSSRTYEMGKASGTTSFYYNAGAAADV